MHVVWSRSHTGEHHSAHVLVALAGNEPAREDDPQEVQRNEYPTLLA